MNGRGANQLLLIRLPDPSILQLQLAKQPGSREGPVALCRGSGDTKGLGSLFDRHSDEVAKLHHLGLARLNFGKAIEDLVHGRYRVHETQVLERNHPSPLLVTVPAPGGVVAIE